MRENDNGAISLLLCASAPLRLNFFVSVITYFMIIHVFDEQQALTLSPQSAKLLIEQVIREEKRRCDEVSLYFVDTATISSLHLTYFDDGSPTDCISFPLDEDDHSPYIVLGDVFVCPETAIDYAKKHGLDPYEETTLYIVHGLLHLMGYDDIEETDRQLMRQAEQRHMARIKSLALTLQK